jgi:hypothetical protein
VFFQSWRELLAKQKEEIEKDDDEQKLEQN